MWRAKYEGKARRFEQDIKAACLILPAVTDVMVFCTTIMYLYRLSLPCTALIAFPKTAHLIPYCPQIIYESYTNSLLAIGHQLDQKIILVRYFLIKKVKICPKKTKMSFNAIVSYGRKRRHFIVCIISVRIRFRTIK